MRAHSSMANRPVEFHPEARAEYLAALAWYRERSSVAAENFASAIRRAVDRISEAPERWPIYSDECRKYTLHEFPFSLVYHNFLTPCSGSSRCTWTSLSVLLAPTN